MSYRDRKLKSVRTIVDREVAAAQAMNLVRFEFRAFVPATWVPMVIAAGEDAGWKTVGIRRVSGLRNFPVFERMQPIEPRPSVDAPDTKTCPRCAEDVKGAALVCRYCGHEFT